MIDVILNFLNWLRNWSNLLLVGVGLSAFGVYYWQKRDEKRAAATLVKGQIDLIEERVLALKGDHQLGDISIYHSKTILQENLWERYKHILIKSLQKSDAEIIQKFFDSAEQIENVRGDIVKLLKISWENKGRAEMENVGLFIKDNPIEQAMPCIQQFQQGYRPLSIVYIPDIVINSLVKQLNDFTMLSGTTAYQKIQQWSYDKR